MKLDINLWKLKIFMNCVRYKNCCEKSQLKKNERKKLKEKLA